MTKEEFEVEYIERSNITKEFYDQHFVTLPCKCGVEICGGFAAVGNDNEMIRTHLELYT